MFGKMFTVAEVQKALAVDYGLEINANTITAFRQKHFEKIKEMQLEYQTTYTDFRLGYTRGRIEELIWLYNNRREIYLQTKSKEDEKRLSDLMKQIREETGANQNFNLNISGQLDVNHIINPQNMKTMLGEVTVMSLILARVAARMGKNPAYLAYRLETSMYAKFNGTQPLPIDEEGQMEEIVYPSAFVYNFDQIQKQEEINKASQKQKQAIIDITPQQEEKTLTTREKLLKLLQEKQSEASKQEGQIKNTLEQKGKHKKTKK